MLPQRAIGIFAATWMVSFRSPASISSKPDRLPLGPHRDCSLELAVARRRRRSGRPSGGVIVGQAFLDAGVRPPSWTSPSCRSRQDIPGRCISKPSRCGRMAADTPAVVPKATSSGRAIVARRDNSCTATALPGCPHRSSRRTGKAPWWTRSSPVAVTGAISLHFNKGLAGASANDLAAAKDTAMNPGVLDAFALAIIAGNGPSPFPGIPGHEPDLTVGRRAGGFARM
jgi:hypothetical protein